MGIGNTNKSYVVELIALKNIPLVESNEDLGSIICSACASSGIELEDRDIIVVASKIVSKAEGRLVSLKGVTPSNKAIEIAEKSGKDPRVVELMLSESKDIISVRKGIVTTLHRLGFICTSACVDRSNAAAESEEMVSLLPLDPDKSASRIRRKIWELTHKKVGVLINDSLGVQYRHGSIGMAVGISGVPAMLVGVPDEKDLYGKRRNVMVSFADEASAAGSLLMGQSNQGRPIAIIRGLDYPDGDGKLSEIIETDRILEDMAKLKEGKMS